MRRTVTEGFVDTDVVVRLLTGDDPGKQRAAAALFAAVERGKTRLFAPDTVIADAVYVLSSPRLYAVPRPQVRDLLLALLRLPQLALDKKPVVLKALELFGESSLDFGDAMLIATMHEAQVATLYSFDQDFDRITGLTRLEPAA